MLGEAGSGALGALSELFSGGMVVLGETGSR